MDTYLTDALVVINVQLFDLLFGTGREKSLIFVILRLSNKMRLRYIKRHKSVHLVDFCLKWLRQENTVIPHGCHGNL
jgi:hypothetical protein